MNDLGVTTPYNLTLSTATTSLIGYKKPKITISLAKSARETVRWTSLELYFDARSTSVPSLEIVVPDTYKRVDPVKDLENLFSEVDALGDSIHMMSYDEWRRYRTDDDEQLSRLYGLED